MNTQLSSPKTLTGSMSVTRRDIQSAPVCVGDFQSTPAQQLKVDLVYRLDERVIVAGWCTAKIELRLKGGDTVLDVRRMPVSRPDVVRHLGLPPGEPPGFVLIGDYAGAEHLALSWHNEYGEEVISEPFTLSDELSVGIPEQSALGQALIIVALASQPHTPQWRSLIKKIQLMSSLCRHAKGFLEAASTCEQTNDAIVVGWVVHAPNSLVWLEDDMGHTYSLENAYRRFRQDVHDAVGHEFGHASRDAGMVLRVPGLKSGSMVKLKTLSETGVHLLSEVKCDSLPIDPIAAARWLFSIGTPLADLHRRVPLVDEPLLRRLMQYREEIWSELPIQAMQLGKPRPNPCASVIVPLYGRADFVEHQLIEFCTDPWFIDHCELIYVIDDPKLVDGFHEKAEALYRLYKLPFRWVWGSVNRGFSGANNLGVRHAEGEVYIFLNSDAFPQEPGWVGLLVDVLKNRPDIGAVGTRLLYADGSIQHAGMEFMRRNDLGIWVNHHPRMGLEPSLDPAQELTLVSCVTGACLAVRRTDFERIDGWDTGYLIGDFEDSDLCLKLRAQGFKIAYLPDVQLTHLERQSFKLLGHDEFRTRVVIYNAVRHQTRWAPLIESSVVQAKGA